MAQATVPKRRIIQVTGDAVTRQVLPSEVKMELMLAGQTERLSEQTGGSTRTSDIPPEVREEALAAAKQKGLKPQGTLGESTLRAQLGHTLGEIQLKKPGKTKK